MPTYRIIGADGKEYGPITVEQMRQWIAEGRVNTQTQVLVEGTTEWRRVGELPEFAASLPIAPPGLPAGPLPGAIPGGAQQVNGPAIGLMVVAIMGLVYGAASILIHLLDVSFMPKQDLSSQAWAQMFSGPLGLALSGLGLLISGLVLFGAIKMKRLENYGLALTAAILATFPCTSPCCVVGLPIGIWALVILAKAEVKAAFR